MFEKSSKDLDQLLAGQITDKSKKGFGYNDVPSPHPLILNRPTPLDLSYSGLEVFKQPEVNEYGPRDSSVKPTTSCDKESDNSKENIDDSLKQQQKTDSSSIKSPLKVDKDWKEKFFCHANQVSEEEPKKARENNDAPIIEDWVSDDEDDVEPIHKVEKKTVIPTATKKEFVKPEKLVSRSVSCPNVHKHMVPRAVLMKTGLKTVNNARPVNTVRSVNTGRPFSTARSFNIVRPSNTAHPKSTVHWARPRTYFQNQAQSIVYMPFYKRTALTKRSYNQNVNTGRQNVNTGRQNVNTVRARGFNAVKPSACWVWKPIKPNGASLVFNKYNYIDARGRCKSGCSRANMSGNLANPFRFQIFCWRFMLLLVVMRLWWERLQARFKNNVMDEFCKEKGIKIEYSVARKPQENGVAERKNRTLIKAARTMLVDSKLPTTFWAEAVSTACYVQNKVLVVKPHNKTPYELFMGIKPAIGFMKPFGCHVIILNTLDKLGKFDGKSDEGFFVGYSLSSKAFRVYNIRTRNGPKWLFDLDSLTQSMNYVPVVAGSSSNVSAGIQGVSESSTSSQQDQDCIVMPIWKDASYFDDASLKSVADAQIQDQDGTHDDCSLQNNGTADQQVNTATPEDLMGQIPTSEDTQVEDQEIELGNISPSYAVSSTPYTRIHKDHPIDHVIGDVQSSVQTRRMTTSYS
ncbi:putative ribonuclease H-like domain-containing protein, partial [Tanacetum coccineum]